jgi:catechol 2,3-dioxygenase
MTTQGNTTNTTSTLIDSIGRVDLRVQEIARAVDFYRDIVGLEVVNQTDQRASLRAPGGPVLLTLEATGVDTPADRGATGLFHTAFLYPDRVSLADALARLVEGGYRIGAGDHGVSEALYVDDPDGNGIELYRDRPVEDWPKPGPGERVGMHTAAVDLKDLLSDSQNLGAASTAAPEGTRIGHVHLQVSDLERTLRFYVDGLGLDLMATMMGSAGFMSSGGYHHHIGANTWNSRGRGPAPRNRAGLDRLVLRVPSSEDLDRARSRLGELGFETAGSPEELIVRDPDGIELRFIPS